MKYLSLLLLIVACNSRHETYPRIVHNACTGLWAIQTGNMIEGSNYPRKIDLYYGTNWNIGIRIWSRPGDTNFSEQFEKREDARLGAEYTYPDSAAAAKAWAEHQAGKEEAARKADSTKRANDSIRKSTDSIFKCQHNYQ